MTPITLPAMIPIDELLPSSLILADIVVVKVFIKDILFETAVDSSTGVYVIVPEVFMVGVAVLLLVLVELGVEL